MTIDPSEIAFEQTKSKGRYVYRAGGATAEMTVALAGERLVIIDHTEVPDVFRGQGVGAALVARAVADARVSGKKIIPLCPFAASQFRRHGDWADVLQQGA